MEYGALTLGMADELLCHLQTTLAEHSLSFSPVSTVQEASRQLNEKLFHLLIVDLEYLRSIGHTGWLESIRHSSFVPLVILSDTPEEDMSGMVKLGADICVSNKRPYSTVADVAFAQFRRYTEYNHHTDPQGIEAAPFRKTVFSDLTEKELQQLQCTDQYALDRRVFPLLGKEIEVLDGDLARALAALTPERRAIVMLSYLLDMTDMDIADLFKLNRTTVRYRRRSTLLQLRKIMEGFENE